ncbi:hypothetical protein HDU93_004985 [Gonapodya sp. JEL0774]|nr:hypothetical protein HDU93_004985 [Gonapodya sp. JEL0774]
MTSLRNVEPARTDSALDVARHVRIGLLLADYMDALDWMQDLAEKWGSHDKCAFDRTQVVTEYVSSVGHTRFQDFFSINVPNTYYNTPTSKVEVTITHFDCWKEDLPTESDLKTLDCCIVTGSTLGGNVILNPLGIEEGTAVVNLTPAFHRIFKTDRKQMRLCLGHQDVVEKAIPGGEVLGYTDKCAVQGVVYGDTVLTFQVGIYGASNRSVRRLNKPHPEILAGSMMDFLDRRWENLAKSQEMYTGGEIMQEATYIALKDDLTDAQQNGVDDMWVGAKILGWIMGEIESDEELEKRRLVIATYTNATKEV